MKTPTKTRNAGFSLVELIIAVVVLAVGALGLAGTTMYVVRQTDIAKVNTARAVAVQYAMERIRSMPFNGPTNGADTLGAFQVSWTVLDSTAITKSIRVVTVGPGTAVVSDAIPNLVPDLADTFVIRKVRR